MDQASGVIGNVQRALTGLGSAVAAPAKAMGGLMDGLGKVGLAAMGIQAVVGAARGLGDVLGINVLNTMEQARAGIQAFTKDAGQTEQILGMVRDRAAKTPFAFNEMATAAGAMMPIFKSTGISLETLLQQAEILAASNPMEGLAGASFSLREAMTGDFTSIIERFNLSRQSINQWKEEGLSNFEIVQRAMQEMGFDADLVAAKSETLEGRWSTFNDTLDTFKAKAGESLFDGLKQGLIFLQGAFDANQEAIMGFAESISKTIGSSIKIAQALFQAFTTDAGAMGIVLEELANIFGQDFANAMQPFIQAFMEAIPAIQQFASESTSALQGFVSTTTQLLSGDLNDALSTVNTTVVSVGAQLGPAFAAWAAAFVEWIGPAAAQLLGELDNIAVAVAGWIVNFGVQANTMLYTQWIPAFVQWVGPVIGRLIPELMNLAASITGWIVGINVQFYTAAVTEWVPAFIRWIPVAAGQIPGAMAAIGSAIIAFIQGLGPQMMAQAQSLAANFISGLQGGIASGAGSLRAAGAAAANAANEGAEMAAGVESPSTVWAEIGRQMAAGLGIGLKDNAFSAVNEAQELIDSLTEIMRDADIAQPVIDAMGDIVREIEDASASVQRETKKLEGLRKARDVDKLFNEDPKMLEFRQRELELDRQILALQEQMIPFVKARKQAELELRQVREEAAKSLKPLEEALDQARENGSKKAIEAAQKALEAGKEEAETAIDLAQQKVDAAEDALKPFEQQMEQFKEVQDALDLEKEKFDLVREAVDITHEAIIQQQERETEFHKARIQAAEENVEKLHEVKRAAEEAAEALDHVASPDNLEGRAEGGAVFGGHSYLVGERGPEVFTPGRTGMITPNHLLGGPLSGIGPITMNFYGGDPQANARAVRDELIKLSRRNGGSAFGGLG